MSDGTWGLPGVTHWDGCGEIGTPEHEGCFISMEHQSAPPPERAILTDLIAELRNECRGYPEYLADEAEARLREAGGDEGLLGAVVFWDLILQGMRSAWPEDWSAMFEDASDE